MTAVHKNLGITSGDWNVFRRHLDATFEALDLSPAVRRQLAEMIDGLRAQIVAS